MDPLPSCSPYLPSYLPPCPPQLLPFHFPNIIYTCTFPTHFFISSHYPHSYCILALPPYPPISLFWTFLGHLPTTSTLPHHFISIFTVCQGSPFLSWPIPSPCLCLPPYPHFRFFG